jgi:hypothetical protein
VERVSSAGLHNELHIFVKLSQNKELSVNNSKKEKRKEDFINAGKQI